ncbi:sulfatase [Neolewinella aurantiaca]|uniref:Sulfatase n=1 Tax=Neolewinella aurantiaca TaxID=2602767 RepID=A0A5C7FHV7_9BACT|nr:sulfatase [Neolewinella aurantiaca]TXF90081.1 sulfatase [Neolewinella aurantiaca]
MQGLIRTVILSTVLLSLSNCGEPAKTTAPGPGLPNLIVILTDDLGYGDLSCYGSHRIHTPHLDRMAAEGLKFTNFYAFPSCSPSRAALMTGCYPPRVGIPNVIGPTGPAWTSHVQYGLHPDETTLPEVLKTAGYATGMVGKWHLGHWPETMPRRQGFDFFFGLPYSNDMLPEDGYPDLPVYDDEKPVAYNPDQALITQWYTQRSLDFIRENKDTSFFLYLAHSMPHIPLFTGDAYADRSRQGVYADVVEEIDGSVGTIIAELKRLNLDENTLVVFTSDNGPWLTYGNQAGSAGPFREGKGTTFEGGMRVPMIARWPAKIDAGNISHRTASLMDILPTFAALSAAELPVAKIDGQDISALFTDFRHPAYAPDKEPFCYYRSGKIEAVRLGKWKLHIPHSFRFVDEVGDDGIRGGYAYTTTGLELYDLHGDPAEKYNVAEKFPEKADELERLIGKLQEEMNAEIRPPFYPAGDDQEAQTQVQ